MGIEVDVTDHEAVTLMVVGVVQTWGRVDVLVANAGCGRVRTMDTKASTHQLAARANDPPLRRLRNASVWLPVAELLSELSHVVSAIFRDQDRDLAQALRSWGSGWAPKRSVSHRHDESRHQPSGRAKRTEREAD